MPLSSKSSLTLSIHLFLGLPLLLFPLTCPCSAAFGSLFPSILSTCPNRGVQHVHWVMHKCIMATVGGKIHVKYVRSRVKIQNLWSMTKKRSSEILAGENGQFFREKVKLLKFSRKSKNWSKIGGKSETWGENASWPQRGWTLLCPNHVSLLFIFSITFPPLQVLLLSSHF